LSTLLVVTEGVLLLPSQAVGEEPTKFELVINVKTAKRSKNHEGQVTGDRW